MLTTTYNKLFAQAVDTFCVNIIIKRGESAYDDKFTLFYPLIGKDFHINSDLVIYGQATNGWNSKFSPREVRTKLNEIIKHSISESQEEGSKCSLEWINEHWTNKEYNLFRSFFWNVTYKLVKSFYNRTDANWNNIIAWSNLMKIAPVNGGNPNQEEINAQIEYASKLFKKEIDDLAPKNVLIMTNFKKWAEPVLTGAGIQYKIINGHFVEAIGNYNDSRIIVTKRGFLRMTHNVIIEEISKYMIK